LHEINLEKRKVKLSEKDQFFQKLAPNPDLLNPPLKCINTALKYAKQATIYDVSRLLQERYGQDAVAHPVFALLITPFPNFRIGN
jgi:hypothetical protein